MQLQLYRSQITIKKSFAVLTASSKADSTANSTIEFYMGALCYG